MIAQRHTLANALRVAADQYAADAEGFRKYAEGDAPQFKRTVEQFEHQAKEARELADAIEQAATIRLED